MSSNIDIIDTIQKVEPSRQLYNSIVNRIEGKQATGLQILVASGLTCTIILMNIFIFSMQYTNNHKSTMHINVMANELMPLNSIYE